MGKVFLCFLFFVFDQYFSGSKAHKGASPDRFSLCTFVFLRTTIPHFLVFCATFSCGKFRKRFDINV